MYDLADHYYDHENNDLIWEIEHGYIDRLVGYYIDPSKPLSNDVLDIIIDYCKMDQSWHESISFIIDKLVAKGPGEDALVFARKAFALWYHINSMVPEAMLEVYKEVVLAIANDFRNGMAKETIVEKYKFLADLDLVEIEEYYGDRAYNSINYVHRFYFGSVFKFILDMGFISNDGARCLLAEIIQREENSNMENNIEYVNVECDYIEIVDSSEHAIMIKHDEDYYVIRCQGEMVVDSI